MASAIGSREGASAHNSRQGTLDGRQDRVDASWAFPQCPGDCTGCDPLISDPEAGIHSERPLQGGSLVSASLFCFLLPLAAALIGSLLAGEGALRQLAGASGGLLSASILAAWIAGGLKRRWPEAP